MAILQTPPTNWARPAIPKKIKALVMLRQGGRCKVLNVKIGEGFAKVEFDHRPALWERKFDTEARGGRGDTIPPANDPDAIDALSVDAHKPRTKRDAGRKAKGERCAGDKAERFRGPAMGVDVGQDRNRAPVIKGPKIKSRGFAKGGPKQKIPNKGWRK